MQYLIIGLILLIILLAVLKANSKDAPLDLNKLVEALGGKENIINPPTIPTRCARGCFSCRTIFSSPSVPEERGGDGGIVPRPSGSAGKHSGDCFQS